MNKEDLRDWFAGCALKGWLATYSDEAEHPAFSPSAVNAIAENSYKMADAMVNAKAKNK